MLVQVQPDPPMKNIYVWIAIIGWAIWAFASKIVAQKLHPIYMQFSSYIIGFCCIPLYWYLLKSDSHRPEFNWTGFIWCIIGGACGVSAYLGYVYALKTGSVGTTTALISCYPALTFAAAVLFLGEQITITRLVGVILMVSGVVLLGR
jgi:transporter family protein